MFEYNKSKMDNLKDNIDAYRKRIDVKLSDIYIPNKLTFDLYKKFFLKIIKWILIFTFLSILISYLYKNSDYITNLYSKFLNSNKESSVNFIGTILGGLLGFIGAIVIFSLQEFKAYLMRKKNKKTELSLLIVQLLYAYNKLIGMSEQSSSDNPCKSMFQDNLARGNFIFLKDWDKYLVHIADIKDVQCISMFLSHLQSLDESDIKLSRNDYYAIGKQLIFPLDIDSILRKYDKIYLSNNFSKHYREECAFQ